MAHRLCQLLVLIACVAQTGCVTYADRLRQIRTAFYAGDLQRAEELVDEGLKKRLGGNDEVLLLEKAMIQLADGRPDEAEKSLQTVRDRFDYLAQTSATEQAASLLTDDQSLAYAGEDYEQVLIRAMLAIANLMQDGDDAEAYSLQMIDKQQQIIESAVEEDGTNPKAVYQQVALGPYIRALLREETHRDYDDVARNRAMVVSWEPEFAPGRFDLQRAVHGNHSERGHGVVYVFALVGRGPYKEEAVEEPTSAALLIADRILSHNAQQTLPPTLAPIRVPRVRAQINVVDSIGVAVNGMPLDRTETITDVTRMAIAQHEAVFTHTLARAVVRRTVKKSVVYGTKEALGVQRGSLTSIPFDVAGVVWEATERADTRCWGTLPETIQVLRLELPAGDQQISLLPLDQGGRPIGRAVHGRVAVVDGGNSFMFAIFPGPQLVGRVLTSP